MKTTPKNLFLMASLPIAAGLCLAAETQVQGGQAAQKNQQAQATQFMDSAEVRNLAKRQQEQAKSLVNSVPQPTKPNAEIQRTLNSTAVQQEAQRQSELNKSTVDGANGEAVNQMRMNLPKFAQLGSQLKYGNHVVISSNGEEIIALIRNLANAQQVEREATLRKLQTYAERRDPEAVHFMGFVFEYGLWGAAKDIKKAIQYYEIAAGMRYQPSVYNLALIAAYGRDGKVETDKARTLVGRAYAINLESSGRVCGLASFLNYRQGLQTAALKYAKGCSSALAHLAQASYVDTEGLPERVNLLRESLATGVDDGIALIVKISKPLIATDNGYTFCKYQLVSRYYKRTDYSGIKAQATRCFDQMTKGLDKKHTLVIQRDQVIAGIGGFVPTEIATLTAMRKSNKFHYSWAVPYLPFPQGEVDLFEPLLSKVAP